METFFTAEHENIGKHIAMALFMQPLYVEYLHIIYARHFECLIHLRRQFVTTHIAIAVHQQERLH